jgi:hypothetical protein
VLSQYEDLLTRFLPSKETFFRRFHETGIGLASQQSKTTAKAK